jgi:hypothetical protein
MAVSKALQRAQENYRERNKNRGMMRVNVWVPEENSQELRTIAHEMRAEYKEKEAKAGAGS